MLVFSGQYVDLIKPKLTTRYRSYIEFDWLEYYPALSGHWEEHYLGETEGKIVILSVAYQARIEGRLI